MLDQVLEGIWEEITQHANEWAGKRVRLTVLEDDSTVRSNEAMLAALREVKERSKDMPFTSGEDIQRLLREARAGAMYGYDSVD